LQNVNQTLEKNQDSERELQVAFKNNLVTSLVGKDVEIPSNEVEYAGATTEVNYSLGAGVRSATLSIVDARGQSIRQYDLDVSKARGSIDWRGDSDSGAQVPEGAYRVFVRAEGIGGAPVTAEVLQRVRVEAVRYGEGESYLWAGGRELTLGDLRGVLETISK